MSEFFAIMTLFGLPALALIFFIISLVLFLRTPKENIQKRKKALVMLIISAVLAGIFILALCALMVIMMLSIAYM